MERAATQFTATRRDFFSNLWDTFHFDMPSIVADAEKICLFNSSSNE
jgi:hypothetical protein